MSAMEINKLIAAVLTAVLIFMVIDVAVDVAFPERVAEKTVVPVPAAETEATAAAEPAAAIEVEEPAAAEPVAAPAALLAPAAAEPVAALAALLARADPDRGKKVAKKCAACHTVSQGGAKRVGPNLWGVVGASKAAREGFRYSGAIAGLGGAWGYAELDAFLASPKTYAPGTKMAFAGVKKPADRADLIAYLRTLADNPAPLPAAE